ncbi:MAG TPA: hypothetical protein VF543_22505 [Pyrinomonadaceae bacterium]|jgi:hypothetical protein
MAQTQKLSVEEIDRNRGLFLKELRSGRYKKGTIRSDERGRPVVESDADNGYCACALMHDLFFDYNGQRSDRNYLLALDLTPVQCRFIQQQLNDSPLTFPEIADRIEREVFNKES